MIKLKEEILKELKKQDNSEIGRKFVGTIDELVFDKPLKESDEEKQDNPEIGRKFVGDIGEIIIDNKEENLQESISDQKIKVISKKTGKAYQITKDWYDDNKRFYDLPGKESYKNYDSDKPTKRITLKKNNSSKFVGDTNQVNTEEEQIQPKNAQQFIERYMSIPLNNKEISKQSKFNYIAISQMDAQVQNSIADYTDNNYNYINKSIRNKFKGLASSSIEQLQIQIKNMREGLSKCDSYTGICFRVLSSKSSNNNFFQKLNLKPGDTFHCDAFTSTTYDITEKGLRRIESTFLSGDGENYELFIKSKNGKNIEKISENQSQCQVLFDIKSKFKVIDIKKDKAKLGSGDIPVKKLYLVQI